MFFFCRRQRENIEDTQELRSLLNLMLKYERKNNHRDKVRRQRILEIGLKYILMIK